MIAASEIRISVIVSEILADEAVNVIHDTFFKSTV